MTVLIGDVHGKYPQLSTYLGSTEDEVICVGDVAVGFPGIGSRPLFRKNFKFIYGNHDKPDDCRAHPQCLGDFGVYKGMFFISGARSVDARFRTEGIDWWRDEQLGYTKCLDAVELYRATKPEIVISHDCPWQMHWPIFRAMKEARPNSNDWGDPREYPAILAMDEMLMYHRPKLWVFGHWHFKWQTERNGTLFRCLDELETMELPPLTPVADTIQA